MTGPVLLSPVEAAAYLGLSRTRMFELSRTGEIPAIHLGQRSTRFHRADLDAYAEKLRREALPAGFIHPATAPPPTGYVAPLTHEQRLFVFNRARGCCEYCGFKLNRREATWQIDHIKPRAAGGDNEPSNLALACRSCNGRKGDTSPGECARGHMTIKGVCLKCSARRAAP